MENMSLCKGEKVELADENLLRRRQYCLYTQHGDVPWSVWSGLVAVNGQGDWKLVSKESFPSAVSAFTAFIGAHIKTPVHSCVLANAHNCPCFFFCVFHFFMGRKWVVGALTHRHRLGDSCLQTTIHSALHL